MTLKQMRMAVCLTQEKLAKRLGVSAMTYHRWESGKNMPSPKHIAILSRELEQSPTNIVNGIFEGLRTKDIIFARATEEERKRLDEVMKECD